MNQFSHQVQARFNPEPLEETDCDNSFLELQEVLSKLSGSEGYLSSMFAPVRSMRELGGLESFEDISECIAGLEALAPNYNYNTDHSVYGVFEGLVEDLEITPKWVSTLRRFVYGFATKDNDHAEFFGTPYLGTHRIVFKTADRVAFFTDIIDVDEVKLRDELIKCKWINKDFKVSSDAFNLSIVYLMHKVHKSNLPKNMKDDALVNLVVLFHYRILTSIMNHYFAYLVKPSVAQTAYNKLSMKFDIKRYGSWNALFKARAEFIIDPKTGIHYDTFTKMDNDKKIVYMVNDMESRLKGVVNDFTKVLYEVKDSVNLVETESGFVISDGQIDLKDIQKNVNAFRTYINTIITDGHSFYKQELLGFAAKAIDDSKAQKQFEDKLALVVKEFPTQYNHPKGEKYREFVDDVITHLFEYLSSNSIRYNDLSNVVYKLRGGYTSNKSVNELVHKLRKNGDKLITSMTGIKTQYSVACLRNGLMLYIVIRTLVRDYYK